MALPLVAPPRRGHAPNNLGPLYAASGFCALLLQITWYHKLADTLGASGTTFLIVLCAFIGGLGAGSALSSRVYSALDRRFGAGGLRHFGRTELLVALSALVLYGATNVPLARLLTQPYTLHADALPAFFGQSVAYQLLRIGVATLAVGVPCLFMGLSYPYICGLYPGDTSLPSRLYSWNTLGACGGLLFAETIALRTVGYEGCLWLAAAGVLALGLYFLSRPDTPRETPVREAATSVQPAPVSYAPAIVSGFLCGGLEALAFAFVKLSFQATRASFAFLSLFAILGIFLASRLVNRFHPRRGTLLGIGAFGLLWCAFVWFLQPRLSESLASWGARSSLDPFPAGLLVTALVVGIVSFPPYLAWSTFLPDVCDRLHAAGRPLHRVYAWNTVAFLAGVLVFGWVLPWINVFLSIRVFALGAALLLLFLAVFPWDREVPVAAAVAAATAAPLAILALAFTVPRSLELRILPGGGPEGRQVVDFRSSPQHLFWVRENVSGAGRSLMFDRFSMSGSLPEGQRYMRTMAHVPLLLHEKPKMALLICFGVGMTADAIRRHESIDRLDIVDLNPEVFALNRHFEKASGAVLADPRVRLFADDGRQYLKLTNESYDFATMEPPPPLMPGISRLYSAEYYEALKERLNPGALVSQWLPEAQMPAEAVDLVVRTFVDAFPHALLFVGAPRELILVGSSSPIRLSRLEEALPGASDAVRRDLARFGITRPWHVYASVLRAGTGFDRTPGPLIQDGYVSLEALHAGPVMALHPRSPFVLPKASLQLDPVSVLAALEGSSAEERERVREWWSTPASAPELLPWIPSGYFAPGRTPHAP